MSNSLTGSKWLFTPVNNDFTPFVMAFGPNGAMTMTFNNGIGAEGTYVQSPNLRSFTFQADVSNNGQWAGVGSHKNGTGGGTITLTLDIDVVSHSTMPYVMTKQ